METNYKTNNVTEHNMVKNPKCLRADQLALSAAGDLNYRELTTLKCWWSERDLNLSSPNFKSCDLTIQPHCLQST